MIEHFEFIFINIQSTFSYDIPMFQLGTIISKQSPKNRFAPRFFCHLNRVKYLIQMKDISNQLPSRTRINFILYPVKCIRQKYVLTVENGSSLFNSVWVLLFYVNGFISQSDSLHSKLWLFNKLRYLYPECHHHKIPGHCLIFR